MPQVPTLLWPVGSLSTHHPIYASTGCYYSRLPKTVFNIPPRQHSFSEKVEKLDFNYLFEKATKSPTASSLAVTVPIPMHMVEDSANPKPWFSLMRPTHYYGGWVFPLVL